MPSRIPRASLLAWENPCITSHRLSRKIPNSRYDHQRAQSTSGHLRAKSLFYCRHGNPNEVLDLHTYSIPPPHSNLVTLRTLSAPVSSLDALQIQGRYPILPPFTDAISTPTPSAVPGNDACLEVIATGSSVTTVAKGDWVIPRAPGLGTWRTHLQVDEGSVMRVEKEGSTEMQVASVCGTPLKAWQLLKDFVDLKEGDWFVQNGASTHVGLTITNLATLWGLRSIAIVKDPVQLAARLQMRNYHEKLGATKVFFEPETNGPGFKDLVNKLTNGQEVRLGLDCVGRDQTAMMATILSPGAQLITYGNMSRNRIFLSSDSMIFRDILHRGYLTSRWSVAHPKEKEKTIGELLKLMKSREIMYGRPSNIIWGSNTPKSRLIRMLGDTLDAHKPERKIQRKRNFFVFE